VASSQLFNSSGRKTLPRSEDYTKEGERRLPNSCFGSPKERTLESLVAAFLFTLFKTFLNRGSDDEKISRKKIVDGAIDALVGHFRCSGPRNHYSDG
jgi:hypothetical protein